MLFFAGCFFYICPYCLVNSSIDNNSKHNVMTVFMVLLWWHSHWESWICLFDDFCQVAADLESKPADLSKTSMITDWSSHAFVLTVPRKPELTLLDVHSQWLSVWNRLCLLIWPSLFVLWLQVFKQHLKTYQFNLLQPNTTEFLCIFRLSVAV